MGVGPQPDLIDFFCPLVIDPDIDDILGENAALEQELVVLFQGIDGLFE